MRRLITAVVLAGALLFGAFGAPAAAQNTPVVLDNVSAWWDHLDCRKRINAVNSVAGSVRTKHEVFGPQETYSTTPNDSTREWCHPWMGLGENQRRAVDDAVRRPLLTTTDHGGIELAGFVTKESDRIFDVAGWWNVALSDQARNIAIGTVHGDVPSGTAGNYAALTVSLSARADAAYAALNSPRHKAFSQPDAVSVARI